MKSPNAKLFKIRTQAEYWTEVGARRLPDALPPMFSGPTHSEYRAPGMFKIKQQFESINKVRTKKGF